MTACEGKARLVNCEYMKTLTLEVPDDTLESDVKRTVAIDLFKRGSISLGCAAEMAGVPKLVFMDELSRLKIPVINLSPEELARELADD